jgi:hypothetical protein
LSPFKFPTADKGKTEKVPDQLNDGWSSEVSMVFAVRKSRQRFTRNRNKTVVDPQPNAQEKSEEQVKSIGGDDTVSYREWPKDEA